MKTTYCYTALFSRRWDLLSDLVELSIPSHWCD